MVYDLFFSSRLSLPTDQSQKSSIRGEADLKLGSGCNATPNGENDSIKVCTKQQISLYLFVTQWFELLCISLQQNCVTGHLYLGFSDESADHFFYGTLAPVSLQKLLEVCNVKHKLPGAMETIGFPEGLQVNQSVTGNIVPNSKHSVYVGHIHSRCRKRYYKSLRNSQRLDPPVPCSIPRKGWRLMRNFVLLLQQIARWVGRFLWNQSSEKQKPTKQAKQVKKTI